VILYCLLSSLFNAIASLILGITVYSKNPRDPRSRTFAWMTVTVAAWSLFYFCWQLSSDAETALRLCRWLSAPAIVIPVCYFHFSTRLTGEKRNREVLVGYGLSAVFIVLSFTPWIVRGVRPRMMFPFWPEPGPLYPLYLAQWSYYLWRSWQLLYHAYHQASFLRRNQLQYVLAHTVIGFIGGATNYFLWYGIPIPPVGNVLVSLYMIGVGYAVVRFRLLEVDLLLARMVAYTLIILVLALMMPLFVTLVQLLPVPGIRELNWVVLLPVSITATGLLFWTIPALRQRVDLLVEQRVLGEKLADRARLRQLATQISSIQDEESIFTVSVRSVAEALGVDCVYVFIRSEFDTRFTRRAFVDRPGRTGALLRMEDDSPLMRVLQETRRGVLLDELAHHATGADRHYFSELRRTQEFELVVPIYADAYFYGFLATGVRGVGTLYTELDFSLLETIGLQIGLNLRSRQLERQANQTEKLISLGTLAAGLAHELRNPLVSIQTFSALLKERGHDPEFQQEFGAIMQRDVGRIASIVENVAAFAENSTVPFTPIKIEEVLAGVAEIARPELLRTGVQFRVDEPGDLPPVHANYSQLLQVFLNLLQNAIQALAGRPDGRITVTVTVRADDVPKPMVYITVADNGPGIDPALLNRVFEPFTTTKSTGDQRSRRGMGLGLAIVRRIIQYHQGAIDVTSELGKGTTFHVYLPATAHLP
jgi:two-component system nitrogen regulation sensor histidine kinase GlnL